MARSNHPMKLSRTSIAALLVALVAVSGGCTLVNRVRAKNALNEGARAYKDGRFADAEEKFRTAYELDPSQKNAPLFVARAVQQQYKPGVQTTEQNPDNVLIHYNKPANQADFDKSHQCTTEGLKLAEEAIAIDQNNANA